MYFIRIEDDKRITEKREACLVFENERMRDLAIACDTCRYDDDESVMYEELNYHTASDELRVIEQLNNCILTLTAHKRESQQIFKLYEVRESISNVFVKRVMNTLVALNYVRDDYEHCEDYEELYNLLKRESINTDMLELDRLIEIRYSMRENSNLMLDEIEDESVIEYINNLKYIEK